MTIHSCRVCGHDVDHAEYAAREMMFGTRDVFPYFLCGDCGTLQIAEVPDDIARYYGEGYYSFNTVERTPLKKWLIDSRDQHNLRARRGVAGFVVSMLKPDPTTELIGDLIRNKSSHVLDVGCGSGELLDRMANAGYTRLAGVDPFIAADLRTATGVPVSKKFIHEVTDTYDVVMFNHSLEHVDDPIASLTEARRVLRPGGRVIVRIPTVSCEAWERYGTDWVQLDAPRHFVLLSRDGVARAASAAGLRLTRTIDDSGEFQFTGSELYRRDIPLSDPQRNTTFGKMAILRYRMKARALNRQHRGDQAAFILEV